MSAMAMFRQIGSYTLKFLFVGQTDSSISFRAME